MKRKNIIFIIVIFILLVGIVFIIKTAYSINNSNENITHISDDENIDVDDLINKLLSSEEYSQMSYDEKKEACEKLLKELKAKKAIKDYLYSDVGIEYSFEYKDGSLGGIQIKGWDPNFN